MTELISGHSRSDAEIEVTLNGPYVIKNIENFTNWLGEELPPQSQMTLCRCGQSATKPYCDGGHAATNFSGDKDPKRVGDRRDGYEGQQIEIDSSCPMESNTYSGGGGT